MHIVRCAISQRQRYIVSMPLVRRDNHTMQEVQEIEQSVPMCVWFRRPLDGRSSSTDKDNAQRPGR